MTHDEVYRELERDRENLQRWWEHRADEYRRRALKTQRFPVTWRTEYLSPRRVRYIILVTCIARKYEFNHGLVILALRKEERGYSVYLGKIGFGACIRPMVFLPHVFDRYAERAHVDKTGTDLICQMFCNQAGGHTIDEQRLASKSVRYNGRDHLFMAVKDGVLLGDMEDGIFVVRTFITYDMAGGLQQKQFNHAKGLLLDTEGEIRYAQSLSRKPAPWLIK